MRKIVLPLLASLALASPALANETRVEARGGVIWSNGTSEDTWGGALGYDFDLGQTTFAGLALSGDKIGATGPKVALGAGGRLGVEVFGQVLEPPKASKWPPGFRTRIHSVQSSTE